MFNKIFKTIVLAITFLNVVLAEEIHNQDELKHHAIKEGWQAHMSIMAHDEESPSWIKGSVIKGDTNTKFNETLFDYIPNALADCATRRGFFAKKDDKDENNGRSYYSTRKTNDSDCILDFEGATPSEDLHYTGANLNAWLFNNVINFIFDSEGNLEKLSEKFNDVHMPSIGVANDYIKISDVLDTTGYLHKYFLQYKHREQAEKTFETLKNVKNIKDLENFKQSHTNEMKVLNSIYDIRLHISHTTPADLQEYICESHEYLANTVTLSKKGLKEMYFEILQDETEHVPDKFDFDKAFELVDEYLELSGQFFPKESNESDFSEKDGEHTIELLGKLLQLRAFKVQRGIFG